MPGDVQIGLGFSKREHASFPMNAGVQWEKGYWGPHTWDYWYFRTPQISSLCVKPSINVGNTL